MTLLLSSFIYVTLMTQLATSDKDAIGAEEFVLSRRRRYLVFPEGSSLQLVYCLTVPSIGMGQIFTMGGTAALAWELPHTPYRPLKRLKPEEDTPSTATSTAKTVVDSVPTSGGWMLEDGSWNDADRKSYYKTYVEDHLLLRRPYNWTTANGNYQTIHNRKRKPTRFNYGYRTIGANEYANIDDSYVPPDYHFIHRKTRRDLYAKIQKFFMAQNKDGKACLLKSICEVGNLVSDNNRVGTFMEEILKAIFVPKPHRNYPDEDEFDRAYGRGHNCTDIYPTCKSSVWNI